MYPNPTSGKLNFTFTGEAIADSYTAQVFDMTGRTLVNTELRAFGNAAELDLSALQAGSYVVVLTSSTGARMSKPVIIQ
ncbi:MAG: T9SS type A sorting domain-containing protein [Bacteroidota bacterium]